MIESQKLGSSVQMYYFQAIEEKMGKSYRHARRACIWSGGIVLGIGSEASRSQESYRLQPHYGLNVMYRIGLGGASQVQLRKRSGSNLVRARHR